MKFSEHEAKQVAEARLMAMKSPLAKWTGGLTRPAAASPQAPQQPPQQAPPQAPVMELKPRQAGRAWRNWLAKTISMTLRAPAGWWATLDDLCVSLDMSRTAVIKLAVKEMWNRVRGTKTEFR